MEARIIVKRRDGMVVQDIRSNVVKLAHQPGQAPAHVASEIKAHRRIIAEDPDWSLATVPLLKDIVINHIVENFPSMLHVEFMIYRSVSRPFLTENPILKKLYPKDKRKVLAKIAPKIDINVTAHLIDDESYWKRCCKDKYVTHLRMPTAVHAIY